MHLVITHSVRSGLILPLSQDVVDVEFIDVVGKLELNALAAFGSAELADNDQ